MIRFGIIRFSSVNDTEASVFGYSVFTRFVRPLVPTLFLVKGKMPDTVLAALYNPPHTYGTPCT